MDEFLELIGSDRCTHEKALESVASAACEYLELVFLTYARSSYRDVDVMHQGDRGSCKDTDCRIGCEVRCKVAVEL